MTTPHADTISWLDSAARRSPHVMLRRTRPDGTAAIVSLAKLAGAAKRGDEWADPWVRDMACAREGALGRLDPLRVSRARRIARPVDVTVRMAPRGY